MAIIIFIIILLVLVVVHEAGHFFTAKSFGIRVDEFGFGFPPKLFGKKIGETEYSLNALPIGGFVKIFGENPDEENMNGPDAARSFVNKPAWQQALVLVAGVFANFLLAWLLFSIGFMSGLPTSVGSQPAGATLSNVNLTIVSVLPGSPAENAGLKIGDKIVSVQSLPLGNMSEFVANINPDTLKAFVLAHSKQSLEIVYTRGKNNQFGTADTTPAVNKADNNQPEIGIAMDMIGTSKFSPIEAIGEGLSTDLSMTRDTAVGLYTLIAQAIMGHGSLSDVSGPVGMVGIVGDAYQFGFSYLLSFMALISINLAIINLFPFPALDGGRLLFLLIEKIKGSRINPKIANTVNTIGFGILILLMIVITFHDVITLF